MSSNSASPNPLAAALAEAPGPEFVVVPGWRSDCEICDEMERGDGPSNLHHPWHLCQVCGETMTAWPHRTNHYRKHHPNADPKQGPPQAA